MSSTLTPDASQPTPDATPTLRRHFTGGCHCGLVRYTIAFALPVVKPGDSPSKQTLTARFRRCNCSSCQRFGFLHIRVPYAPHDFYVLSPLSKEGAGSFGGLDVSDGVNCLRDYTCFEGNIHWLFCGTCGARCFSVMGTGEIIEEHGEKSWHLKEEQPSGPYKEGLRSTGYLTVNAMTLDQSQEECDISQWQRNGWVSYLDGRDDTNGYKERFGEPHPFGAY